MLSDAGTIGQEDRNRVNPTVAQRPDADAMRKFAGHFATGVAVITATAGNGKRHGLTVNAITSLSLNPPLYLVCLGNRSNTLAAIRNTRKFGINFLRADQQQLCALFAGSNQDKFSGIEFTEGRDNVPLLQPCLAQAVCSVDRIFPGGDHYIVTGRPESCVILGGEPLLYYRGAFMNQNSAYTDSA